MVQYTDQTQGAQKNNLKKNERKKMGEKEKRKI